MKKIVLIPDSFKGTLTSMEICSLLTRAVREILPGTAAVQIPVGDGGEGTADAFRLAMGGQRRALSVSGPHFESVGSSYVLLPDGTAVIEMAAAAGLPLCHSPLDPMNATTYGVGELIADALNRSRPSTSPACTRRWAASLSPVCAISTIPCTGKTVQPASLPRRRAHRRNRSGCSTGACAIWRKKFGKPSVLIFPLFLGPELPAGWAAAARRSLAVN